jgi:glutaconate CoA-transferase subunit B
MDFSSSELMAYRASLELKDADVVFVGIGLPNLACNLARETHAPNLCLIYESGAVGAVPERLPVSIGDPALVTDSLAIVGMADIFQSYLQRGFIEVGFLGGAQVDRWGNINTTVIGDYKNPKVRLPGSGGACEIAIHARKLFLVMKMNPKSFVEKCDFITSPGNRSNGKTRKEWGLPGSGPLTAITDLGVCTFIDGEMTLTETYPGVSLEKIKTGCGWPLKIASDLKTCPPPSPGILKLLREKLDPQKLFLG